MKLHIEKRNKRKEETEKKTPKAIPRQTATDRLTDRQRETRPDRQRKGRDILNSKRSRCG